MSLAVIINVHSRRGAGAVGEKIQRLFPDARVFQSSSFEALEAYVRGEFAERPPSLLLAGGGDGTITGLINLLIRLRHPLPPMGILPLGTGNAWARVSGLANPLEGLKRLARLGSAPPPLTPFNLVRVGDQVAPFAGTGWDAEVLSDFKAQLEDWPAGPARDAHRGFRGYVSALYTRTVARHLVKGEPPRVRVVNLGDEAHTIDRNGEPVPLPGKGKGSVLFEGILGVAGAATIEEYGFGLRAYPFARKMAGKLNVRVYSAKIMQGVVNSYRLWKGVHPLRDMHDFFISRARLEFDRDLPVQVAGDVTEHRRSVEFSLDDHQVQILDWSALPR